jgi:hypothetical protein
MPSKYGSNDRRKELVRPYKIHPVWRGIGFVMMVLVPVMSGAAAMVLRDYGRLQRWSFMKELGPSLRLPDIFYSIPVISNFSNWVSSINDLPVMILFFILFLMVYSGVLSILYAMIYRLIGPPRYSALDAPATKNSSKRYTR